MGSNINSIMDSRTTSGSVLPVTPYEIWQYEKYGNFYKEKDPEPTTDMDDLPALSIKVYANN
jgi:hypothetical protein